MSGTRVPPTAWLAWALESDQTERRASTRWASVSDRDDYVRELEEELIRLREVERAAKELRRVWNLGIDHPTIAEWDVFSNALKENP